MTEQPTKEPWHGWGRLEILGHIAHEGYIQEVQEFGVTVIQVEPIGETGELEPPIIYGTGALFGLHRLSEEAVKATVAQRRKWAEQRQLPFGPPRVKEVPLADEMCHQCFERPPEPGEALCAKCAPSLDTFVGDEGDEPPDTTWTPEPESFQGYGHPTVEELIDAMVEDRVYMDGGV